MSTKGGKSKTKGGKSNAKDKKSETKIAKPDSKDAKAESKDEKADTAPNPIPGAIGYIFDIIVVRLDITDKDAKQTVENDPSKLEVQATFNKEQLKITSSRINVVEFKSGKSYEFAELPSTLRDDLSKNKLKLRIMHGSKEIGLSLMDWPDSFKDCLIDPECAGELTHVFESEFKQCDSGKVCGIIEVIVRLQTKCSEWDITAVCTQPQDLCKEANKIIDPNDILFVVGEDRNPCSCSQVGVIPATDSDRSLNPTCLDLSNFRAVNGQTVPNADILSCVDPACGELENITNQYQQLIDSLMNKHKPTPSCSKKPNDTQSCSCPRHSHQSSSRQCAGLGHVECPSGSSTGSQHWKCFKCGNPNCCRKH